MDSFTSLDPSAWYKAAWFDMKTSDLLILGGVAAAAYWFFFMRGSNAITEGGGGGGGGLMGDSGILPAPVTGP
jgi:hypothetical protein